MRADSQDIADRPRHPQLSEIKRLSIMFRYEAKWTCINAIDPISNKIFFKVSAKFVRVLSWITLFQIFISIVISKERCRCFDHLRLFWVVMADNT